MAEATERAGAGAVSPDPDRLRAAAREARDDAAPFALAAAGILIALALVNRHAHWDLLGQPLWWIWLLVAAPYVFLSATLLLGLGRLIRHNRRREIVITLLALVWVFNVLGVVVLVISLVSHSAVHITGRQLLLCAGAVDAAGEE
jgi:4-amino-4-deoxy-L-arabinose transferase-like glycosyltransferase